MLKKIDFFGRRCIAWPIAFVAMAMTMVAQHMLRFASCLLDIKLPKEYFE